MEITYSLGELTDISAKIEALVQSLLEYLSRRSVHHPQCCGGEFPGGGIAGLCILCCLHTLGGGCVTNAISYFHQ